MLGWGESHASMRTRVQSLAPTWKQSACALSTRERDSNQKISRFKTNSGAQLRITPHAILGPADAYTHVCSHVCKEEYTEKKTTPKIVLSQSHCIHKYNCYHVSSMYPSPISVSDPYSDHVPWKQSLMSDSASNLWSDICQFGFKARTHHFQHPYAWSQESLSNPQKTIVTVHGAVSRPSKAPISSRSSVSWLPLSLFLSHAPWEGRCEPLWVPAPDTFHVCISFAPL